MTGFTKPNSSPPFILGVAGGSGSGKTYFARALRERFGAERCALILQDDFYIDQSHRFDHDGGSVNFDHPDSIDFPLLRECLQMLKKGRSAELPSYDFATHKRRPERTRVQTQTLVIVDGILIFHDPLLRAIFDERIFVDTPEELRFQRRLERDVRERGRTPEGVRRQFHAQVKPMHDRFVEPTKAYANTLIRDSGSFEASLEAIFRRLCEELRSP